MATIKEKTTISIQNVLEQIERRTKILNDKANRIKQEATELRKFSALLRNAINQHIKDCEQDKRD